MKTMSNMFLQGSETWRLTKELKQCAVLETSRAVTRRAGDKTKRHRVWRPNGYKAKKHHRGDPTV